MDINVKGLIYTCHLAYWAFSQGPSGSTPPTEPRTHHLLLVGSMASFLPAPDTPLYTSSKHAVLGLFRGLKMPSMFPEIRKQQLEEIKNRGYRIHINLLCPYFADTPLIHALDNTGRPKLTDAPGIQLVTVQDVVKAAGRLVTDESENGGGKALVVTTPTIAHGKGVDGTYQLKDVRSKL
jgi:NAD(P)-dependent dehydrogenase (short-subunit alcohol dehydrogenase family)